MGLINKADNMGLFNIGDRRNQTPRLTNVNSVQNLYSQPINRDNRQIVDPRFATGRTDAQQPGRSQTPRLTNVNSEQNLDLSCTLWVGVFRNHVRFARFTDRVILLGR